MPIFTWGSKWLPVIHCLMTVLSTRQSFICTQYDILAPTKRKRHRVVISWLMKTLGKEALNISESASRRFPCVVLQVASLLYVLHHGALHVAFQHIHHSHGDANRGSSAPGASECWGGARGHQYCRQHHYWRKRANRYLSMLAILFSFVSQWLDSLIHIIQILSRSELSDLYCQRPSPSSFFLYSDISFKKWKKVSRCDGTTGIGKLFMLN